jgi:ornithine cyclodeaminase
MLLLSRPVVVSLLDPDELRNAVSAAMAELSSGKVSMPSRIAARVDSAQALLAAMPAYLPGMGILAAKLVSLFPNNSGIGIPTHQAVVLVFDDATGSPLAVIDGTSITAARTAAGSALSVDLLARPDSRVLAVLGTGAQARSHLEAVTRVRRFDEIRVAGRDLQRTEAFAQENSQLLGVRIQATDSLAVACEGADVICAATHSPTPVVRRAHVAAGTHITSVGCNTAGREVDSRTVSDALLVVESREAVLAPPPSGSPDIRIPIEEGLIGPDHIHAEIGELVTGSRPARTSEGQITLYRSVGVAVQDAAAAALVLRKAREIGAGQQVKL